MVQEFDRHPLKMATYSYPKQSASIIGNVSLESVQIASFLAIEQSQAGKGLTTVESIINCFWLDHSFDLEFFFNNPPKLVKSEPGVVYFK